MRALLLVVLLPAVLTAGTALAADVNERVLAMTMPAGKASVVALATDGGPGFIARANDDVPMQPETIFERDAMASSAGKVDSGAGAVFNIVPYEMPSDLPAASLPPANLIRFKLKRIEGHRDMILFIENGYDVAITYQAAFSNERKGPFKSTSTCPVPHGKIWVEQWPHSFGFLMISEVKAMKPGDPVDPSCAQTIQIDPEPNLG